MTWVLWAIQVALAAHTAIGAVWKVRNSEESVGTLKAIPHPVWLASSGLDILIAIGLILPALVDGTGRYVPLAAGLLVLEMLAYVVVHVASGSRETGPPIYWGGVIVVALGGRVRVRPLVAQGCRPIGEPLTVSV